MINVELSSIWSCVSLPQLLSCEKDLFDAHLHLRSNQPNAPEFLGWLGQPDALTAKTVHAIRKACETISGQWDTLVVAGAGEGYLAAKAGIEAIGGRYRNLLDSRMRILFTGDSLASSDWIALCRLLEGHDFCLLLLSSEGVELEMCAASRALRWLMERRYGQGAKERVYVSAKQGSGLAVMAKEEGFTFLPMDGCLGGGASALNAGTLLVMAAAGIDPLGVLEGAAEGFSQYDLRAFENPVWMYAGALRADAEGALGGNFRLLYAGLWSLRRVVGAVFYAAHVSGGRGRAAGVCGAAGRTRRARYDDAGRREAGV